MAATDAMVALYSTTLAAATSSVTIAGIPTTGYRDLRIVFQGSVTSGSVNHFFRLNGDTGSNYNWVGMGGTGSSALSNTGSNQTTGALDYYGYLASGTLTSMTFDLFDYAQIDKHKTGLVRADNAGNGTTANAIRWASTAAVTSIVLFPASSTFTAGSTFELFGIKA